VELWNNAIGGFRIEDSGYGIWDTGCSFGF